MNVLKLLQLLICILLVGVTGCGGGGSSTGSPSSGGNSGGLPNLGGGASLPTVVALQLSQNSLTVPSGTSQQLQVTALLSDGNRLDATTLATWSSASPGTVSVSSGLVRALAPTGQVEVTASYGGFSDRCLVTLSNPVLIRFTVAPSPLNLPAGLQDQLVATGEFSDGSRPNITQDVDWLSDDTAVARVDNTPGTRGKVNGVARGGTNVRATFRGQTVTVVINVSDAQLVGIDIDPAAVSLAKGVVRPFRAFGRFSDGVPRELTAVATWASGDDTLALVSNVAGTQGTVVARSPGNVEITATSGGFVGRSQVTVTAAELVSLRLEPMNASVAKGLKLSYRAHGTFTDSSNSELTDQVTWSTSDPTIALASNASGTQGEVAGREIGKVQIRATLFNIVGETDLSVTAAVLTGLTVSPQDPVVSLSKHSQVFVANGIFSDGSTANISASATWESSNTAVSTIAPGGAAALRTVGNSQIKATVGPFSATSQLQVVRVAGLDWTRHQGNDFVSTSAQFNGKFYFGQNEGIVSSVDGKVWEPHRMPVGNTGRVTDLLAEPTRLLAVGDLGHVFSSDDGENWSLLATLTGTNPTSITFGNGLYVIVGQNGLILTSADAVHWTQQTSGVSGTLNDVTFGNDIFVAVGNGNPPNARTLASTDGVNWTSSSALTVRCSNITFGDGKFVAGTDRVMTSVDGVNWLLGNAGNGSDLFHTFEFFNGTFVGLTDDRVFRSDDGVVWAAVSVAITDASYRTICLGNGRFLMGGFLGTPFQESSDLITWTRTGYPSRPRLSRSVAFGAGRYVIAGSSSDRRGLLDWQILTSTDGVNWTGIPSASLLDQVVFDGTRFLAIGDGVVATSADGLVWDFKAASGLTGAEYNSLVIGNGRYLASGRTAGVMRTSTDGLVWSPVNYGFPGTAVLDLTFGGGKFVGVANSAGLVLQSNDGLAWTSSVVPGASRFWTVGWGGGTFVAGGDTLVAATSIDGVSWTLQNSLAPKRLADITFANGLFVSVGEGCITTSPDGSVWTLADPVTLSVLGAVVAGAAGGQFVAIGEGGEILTSP